MRGELRCFTKTSGGPSVMMTSHWPMPMSSVASLASCLPRDGHTALSMGRAQVNVPALIRTFTQTRYKAISACLVCAQRVCVCFREDLA